MIAGAHTPRDSMDDKARALTLPNSPLIRVDWPMSTNGPMALWQSIAVFAARLIFAGVFIMAASFKFLGMNDTAAYIASAGFPFPLPLAWIASVFECFLSICFLTGAYFSEAALLAAAYVLFLAFAFHGPSHWPGNPSEFGFFVDHFTFIAGLLFAAVKGPGRILAIRWSMIGASPSENS
jgi:putative oxidoreductase